MELLVQCCCTFCLEKSIWLCLFAFKGCCLALSLKVCNGALAHACIEGMVHGISSGVCASPWEQVADVVEVGVEHATLCSTMWGNLCP